jgi:two-component system, probable response regulator PhcQ
MIATTDYRKYFVLYVDDEERSLKSFERAFSESFKILTASNAAEALTLFEAHKDTIAVMMTDQRMPGEKGVWLLDRVRQLRPNVLRILVTAYSDLQAMIDAVNTGAIYHYVTKPWDPPALESTLKHAIQLFAVQRERDELLREKMSVLQNMMVSDRVVSLGFMAAGLSHHIRNSLVPVKTFIDLVPQQLREEGIDAAASKSPEFWLEYQRTANDYVEKINMLLKELWLVAETPSLGFTDEVHLREVATDTVFKLREPLSARGISAEIAIPDSLPRLTVDKAKFTRMLELVVKDEIVSLPEGSRITISAAPAPHKPENVVITVRDNGPGISEELLTTIFDPFSARSDSPSEHGINLMAAYFIAHYHGGKMEARSASGKGTKFVIELPFTPNRGAVSAHNTELFQKIRRTDQTWEKLLATR